MATEADLLFSDADPAWFRPGVPRAVAARSAQNYARAVAAWREEAADRARGLKMGLEEYERTQKDIKTASGVAAGVATAAAAIAAGTAAVPVIGQVAAAVAALISLVAGIVSALGPGNASGSERDAGARITRGWTPFSWSEEVVTGWYADGRQAPCYYFDLVPVPGPLIGAFLSRLNGAVLASWRSGPLVDLVALCRAYPYGLPLQRVKCLGGGRFDLQWVDAQGVVRVATVTGVAQIPAAVLAPVELPTGPVAFAWSGRGYTGASRAVTLFGAVSLPWPVRSVSVVPGYRVRVGGLEIARSAPELGPDAGSVVVALVG